MSLGDTYQETQTQELLRTRAYLKGTLHRLECCRLTSTHTQLTLSLASRPLSMPVLGQEYSLASV